MKHLVGQIIGQYQIIEEIGRGGMATVYRAYQPGTDRDVAIKVLPPQFTQDSTFMARFEREIDLAARLQHPRILPVFDFGEYQDMPYFVMAYMPGGTLEEAITQEPLPLDQVVRYISQVAQGLDYLHTQGVIHRDLKTSNVLLDADNNVYLADFGIAKVQEATAHLTGTGMIGTPSHMAPEMFTEGKATHQIDVYALGVMLYQLLTGKLPFEADSPMQFMQAHLEQPVPDILHRRSDLPGSVQAVLKKAMAKNPTDRFQSAGELAQALQAAARQPLTETQPRPWWLWAVVGIVVIVGAAAAFFFRSGGLGPDSNVLTATALNLAASNATDTPTFTSAPTRMAVPTAAGTPTPMATVTSTPPPAPPEPVGGGTGLLGFNREGFSYVVDVSCVLAGGVNCNPDPWSIQPIGDISPAFGVWSPDGTRLAFTYQADLRSRSQIFVMDASCIDEPDSCIGKLVKVQENDFSDSILPRWFADGTLLAFQSEDAIFGTDAQCFEQQEDSCLINTQELVKLAEFDSRGYFLSPDGKRIAMLLRGQIGGIRAWAENTEGWKPDVQYNHTLLTPNNKQVKQVAWLPDGRILFLDHFEGESSGEWNTTPALQAAILYLAEANNSVPTIVATLMEGSYLPGGHGGGEFSLSPDGKYVALSMNDHALEDREIWLLDLSLSCVEDYATFCTKDDMIRVTGVDSEGNEIEAEITDDGLPNWSPDGSLIAFVRSDKTNLIDEIEVINDIGRNPIGGDIYVIDFAAALAGSGEDSVTPITSIGSVDFPFTYISHSSDPPTWPPQWQPASDTQP